MAKKPIALSHLEKFEIFVELSSSQPDVRRAFVRCIRTLKSVVDRTCGACPATELMLVRFILYAAKSTGISFNHARVGYWLARQTSREGIAAAIERQEVGFNNPSSSTLALHLRSLRALSGSSRASVRRAHALVRLASAASGRSLSKRLQAEGLAFLLLGDADAAHDRRLYVSIDFLIQTLMEA